MEILDEIDVEVIQMTMDGTLLAKCPKCNIPLDLKEFENLKCNTCGELDFYEILFCSRFHNPSA